MPDEPTFDQAAHTDKFLPLDRDKLPFKFNGNDAAILGLLDEWLKWSVRTGHFKHLFSNRAVAVGSKIAVLHPSASTFILQPGLDSHGFEDPAPTDWDTRMKEVNDDRAALTLPAITWPKDLPAGSVFVINPIAVQNEDSNLLISLGHIFGEHYDDLVEDAAGSGLAFLSSLRARAATASTAALTREPSE